MTSAKVQGIKQHKNQFYLYKSAMNNPKYEINNFIHGSFKKILRNKFDKTSVKLILQAPHNIVDIN